MRRALPLFFMALALGLATACADTIGPANDDDEECGVVVGSQTRCDSAMDFSRRGQ
jgi:hypothetical protein